MPYKRKEIIGNCTLYLGDCIEVMPLVGKIDCIISDPPYNISGLGGGGLGKNAMYSGGKIDKWLDFDVLTFLQNATSKTNHLVCFSSRLGIEKYLRFAVDNQLNYDVMVWHKPNAIPFTNGTMKQDFEYIIRLYDDKSFITKVYNRILLH